MKILLFLTGLAILAGLHVCSGLEISKAANIEKLEENIVLSMQEKTRVDRAAKKKYGKKGSNQATTRKEKKGKKRKQKRKSKTQNSKKDKARKSVKHANKGRKTSRKQKVKRKTKKPGTQRKLRKAKKSTKRKKSRKGKKSEKGRKSRKAKKNLKPKKKDTVDMISRMKSIKNEKTKNLKQRAVYKGTNCEYIDLCALDTKAQNGCKDGEKFVVKGARGSVKTRRQFLILDGKKIIAFLQSGKKITDCKGNMTDVTSKVSCKAIPGAGDMKIEKQNTTAPAPAPVPAPPTQCPGSCNKPDFTLTSNPVVKCPCPEGKTCFTTIKSNAFSHTVTCGKVKETRQCGGPLYGTKKGIFIDIEKYAQPLCGKEKTYLTLIKDLEWKCKDLDIKPCDICTGTTPPAYPPVPCPPTPTPPTPTAPTPTPPTPTPPTPTPPTPTPPTPTPPTSTPPTPTPPTPTPPTSTPPTPTTSTNAPRRRRGLRLPAFVFN